MFPSRKDFFANIGKHSALFETLAQLSPNDKELHIANNVAGIGFPYAHPTVNRPNLRNSFSGILKVADYETVSPITSLILAVSTSDHSRPWSELGPFGPHEIQSHPGGLRRYPDGKGGSPWWWVHVDPKWTPRIFERGSGGAISPVHWISVGEFRGFLNFARIFIWEPTPTTPHPHGLPPSGRTHDSAPDERSEWAPAPWGLGPPRIAGGPRTPRARRYATG